MYDPHQLHAWIALGESRDPIKIDFGAWLKGHDLTANQIEGRIDTEIQFATE